MNHQISQLPSDIIMFEILMWLEVACLLRLRCVSKSFKEIIDSPFFVKKHLRRCKTTKSDFELLFFESGICQLFSVDLNVDTNIGKSSRVVCPLVNFGPGRFLRIVSCCDGIVCWRDDYGVQEIYTLWNPSTRKYREIDPPSVKPLPRNFLHGWFRKDVKSTSAFGYDDVDDDYKIVRIVSKQRSTLEVFSLRDNIWKKLNVEFPIGSVEGDHGVFAKGTVNWFWSTRDSYDVLSFDLCNEELRLLSLPESLRYCHPQWNIDLKEFNGDLCVVSHHWYPDAFGIWALEECGGEKSWRQRLTLRAPYHPVAYLPHSGGSFLTSWWGGYRWSVANSDSFTNVFFEAIEDCEIGGARSMSLEAGGSEENISENYECFRGFGVCVNFKSLVQL